METGIIKYNLNDRGRDLTGQKRNFDTKKIAGYINSQKFQESVKHRDVFGYFGHWVRQKFGLKPSEVVVDKGQLIPIEPAILTTEIKAYSNGDVEHKVKFLDTPTGKIAKSMWESATGGFSSVIDEATGAFYGFDFVNSPNFSTNRGYAFDSANADVSFDSVLIAYDEALRYVETLETLNQNLAKQALEASAGQINLSNKAMDAITQNVDLKAENESLRKQLEQANTIRSRGAERANVLFDGAQAFYETINKHGDSLHKTDEPVKAESNPALERLVRMGGVR